MAEEVIESVKRNIVLLDINDDIKNNILKTFDRYSEILISFYYKAYKNKETADFYLNLSIKRFNNRLYDIIEDDQTPFEYVNYIVNNIDKYSDKMFAGESKESKNELDSLVSKIRNGNYIDTFYFEALTYSSTNYSKLCLNLYKLAKYMGFNDDLTDYYSDSDIKPISSVKVV